MRKAHDLIQCIKLILFILPVSFRCRMTIESRDRNQTSVKPIQGVHQSALLKNKIYTSTVNLIDLAGSESGSIHKSGSSTQHEMKFINKVNFKDQLIFRVY